VSLLYVDASAGLSGDMLLAGMVDLGLPLKKLRKLEQELSLPAGTVQLCRFGRKGIRPMRVTFSRSSSSAMDCSSPEKIIKQIDRLKISAWVKQQSRKVIAALQKAEAHAHKVSAHQVRFHQVGRVDTLINVVGFCLGLEVFRVKQLYSSKIPLGNRHLDSKGKVRNSPGPAALALLRDWDLSFRSEPFEWTTPTGAAILSGLGSPKPPAPFQVHGIGFGSGNPPFSSHPRCLRLLLSTD
jgi:pyridinium-3,5-bisthiocarboxylic acid mononucleotide nickel chelatase